MWFQNSKRQKELRIRAASLSHDLKGPLSTVKACSEGLLRRMDKKKFDPVLFRNYLEIIDDEVNRCNFIADNLICYIRDVEDPEKQKIDIHKSLDQIIAMLSLQGRCKKIEIVKNYDKKMPVIFGCEYELLQVFLAIIVNAIDAMQEEGTLTLKTKLHMNSFFISINNTGEPIPCENLENIFQPFYTTKAMQGGTGLGLFLAKNCIKSLGGHIQVASSVVEGTTFTVVLPF